MSDVTVRSARNWDEVRRTAVAAGRAFPDRNPEGSFFEDLILGASSLPLENTLLVTGETLIGALQVYERQMYVGGQKLWIGGLGNVFVLPEHREEGYGGALLEATTTFLEEKGYAVSLLTTHIPEFYETYGWDVLPSVRARIQSPPSVSSSTAVQFDPADADVLGEVADAYVSQHRSTDGMLVRYRNYWRNHVLANERNHVGVHSRDGTVVGYCIWRETETETVCLEVGCRDGSRREFGAACWNSLADRCPGTLVWHPPVPEAIREEFDTAEVETDVLDTKMVQLHDPDLLSTALGTRIETTEGLRERLENGRYYWSDVETLPW